jgi:hypothetical protein
VATVSSMMAGPSSSDGRDGMFGVRGPDSGWLLSELRRW